MQKKVLGKIRQESAQGPFGGEDWREIHERTRPWETAQFVTADVSAVTGATPKALEHFLNPQRGLVAFDGELLNPGKGKRRMFTGKHVLMIAAAYKMTAIGFPQRASNVLTEIVGNRALNAALDLQPLRGDTLFIYPLPDDDFQFLWIHEGKEEPDDLPVAAWVLDVAKLIDQVRIQLEAIIAGKDIPVFVSRKVTPDEDAI